MDFNSSNLHRLIVCYIFFSGAKTFNSVCSLIITVLFRVTINIFCVNSFSVIFIFAGRTSGLECYECDGSEDSDCSEGSFDPGDVIATTCYSNTGFYYFKCYVRLNFN